MYLVPCSYICKSLKYSYYGNSETFLSFLKILRKNPFHHDHRTPLTYRCLTFIPLLPSCHVQRKRSNPAHHFANEMASKESGKTANDTDWETGVPDKKSLSWGADRDREVPGEPAFLESREDPHDSWNRQRTDRLRRAVYINVCGMVPSLKLHS